MKPGDKVMVVPVQPYCAPEEANPGWIQAMDKVLGTVGVVGKNELYTPIYIKVEFPSGRSHYFLPSWLIPVTETPEGWLIRTKYRTARMPEDYGKPCRVRDHENQDWRDAVLCGYRGPELSYPWVMETGSYRCCEVEDK